MLCENEASYILFVYKSNNATPASAYELHDGFAQPISSQSYPSFPATNIVELVKRNTKPSWSMVAMTKTIVS